MEREILIRRNRKLAPQRFPLILNWLKDDQPRKASGNPNPQKQEVSYGKPLV